MLKKYFFRWDHGNWNQLFTWSISFSHPNSLYSTKCILLPLFHSFSRPPHSFPSLLRLQGLRDLLGFLAAETHWFRWKEIDILLTIAVTLLPRRMQPTADNSRGRQSRTGGGPIYFTTFSSSWYATSMRAARSGGMSVTHSNPSDWLIPVRNQKHKFKTRQRGWLYNM